jgi:transcriptional/translational regulatory protein YebC/TACO1
VVRYPAGAGSADDMLEAAIEAGADNVESDAEGHEVTCVPDDFFAVRDALGGAVRRTGGGQAGMAADHDRDAGRGPGGKVLKLLDALEDSDDVQNVYANFDIPDSVMARSPWPFDFGNRPWFALHRLGRDFCSWE